MTPAASAVLACNERADRIKLDNLCSTFLEAIKAYYDDPVNKRRFEEWQKNRNRM